MTSAAAPLPPVAAVAILVLCGGCSPSAPVKTFEAFYQATARKDAPAFRSLLCPTALQSIRATDDATLLSAFALTRVVQQVRVSEQTEHGAVLDVVDATGQHVSVTLERSSFSKTAWCIAGVAEASAEQETQP